MGNEHGAVTVMSVFQGGRWASFLGLSSSAETRTGTISAQEGTGPCPSTVRRGRDAKFSLHVSKQ